MPSLVINNDLFLRYMTAMGALNIQLDQKTKDMLVRMRVEDEGPDLHRRRTMEDVANLAINNQIQMILPPDGDGAPIGGGLPRGGGRGRGRGGGRGRGTGRGQGRVAGRAQHVGTLLHNGKVQCACCLRSYVQARFQG